MLMAPTLSFPTLTKDRKMNAEKKIKKEYPACTVLLSQTRESFSCFIPPHLSHISDKTEVVAKTQYGKDLVKIISLNTKEREEGNEESYEVLRLATPEDIRNRKKWDEKADDAFNKCRKCIIENKLEMKLVAAHHLIEEPKWVFFFTAEKRIDFRKLVRDLVSIFHQKIELRHIGVRHEARIIGGESLCSREYCCCNPGIKLKPVTIKMLKVQDITFNSSKISGPCGRLLCCLDFEYEYYREAKKSFPMEKSKVCCNGRECVVTAVNVFSKKVKIKDSNEGFLESSISDGRYDSKEKKWFFSPSKVDKIER